MSKTEKPAAEPTEYVVLRRAEPDSGVWEIGAHIEARSAPEAIRRTVGKLSGDAQAGTYVAVPVRSWRPVTVTAEVQTRLKLESA